MDKKVLSELNRSRELMGLKLINEQEEEEVIVDDEVDTTDQPSPDEEPSVEEVEDMDILVDDDIEADVDENELTDDEDSWAAERWEDLTDAVRNIFSRNKKFSGCRGKGACPNFNRMNRRRKLRILSGLTTAFPKFRWPKFRFRLPKLSWRMKKHFQKLLGRG